jgi:hypothetical protein
MTAQIEEKRREKRFTINEYYSVEFLVSGIGCLYQCKLYNISKHGICILVKEGSPILNHFQEGDMLDMRYYKPDDRYPTDYLKTEVRHITPSNNGKFKAHVLVGLKLLEGENNVPE